MGIPAYFAYLVRNYPEIIKDYYAASDQPDMFYIDANSIVYDVIYSDPILSQDASSPTDELYVKIIDKTIKYLIDLILYVNARQFTYIAFDGVAPCAKMEQQRQRRARTVIDGKGITFITPGTPFMIKLNNSLYHVFSQRADCIVSGSDMPGEGEHKIFDHMRKTGLTKKRVLVYGLDADLIILALCHAPLVGEISLLREHSAVTSELPGGGAAHSVSPDARIKIRINVFAEKIRELGVNVHDYIFMSFFLGNDFMPHFPAISIRKDGITKLIDIYKKTFAELGHEASVFTDVQTGRPLWSNVRLFIDALAQKEADWIYFDYLERNKMEMRLLADPVAVENVENTPMLNRGVEKYIAPDYPKWEERYYKALFKESTGASASAGVNIIKLVYNWVEGLEWVMRYYVAGVPDWNWKYKEHYPPLLVDIHKHMPVAMDGESLFNGNRGANQPITAQEQLEYVMPHKGNVIHLEWAYCRYFWESHVSIRN